MLRSTSVAGIRKEIQMLAIAHNLVRLVMLEAAGRQRLPVEPISFIDALRWLVQAGSGPALNQLIVRPHRPGRSEPRAVKRRPKQYSLLQQPRAGFSKP